MKFVIDGAPRTKKNHQHIARVRGRIFIVQSKSSDAWSKSAIDQLRRQANGCHTVAVPAKKKEREKDPDAKRMVVTAGAVNCRAVFYRSRDVGDANNYYAALADALEGADIVANDRQIVSWDGSRLRIDRQNPRVEITLEPMEAA